VSAPSISEISYISKEHGNGQLAQAYALFNMSFSTGFLLGPLWGGFVTERAGWNTMATSLSGLALLTLAPVLVWTGGPFDWKIRSYWNPRGRGLIELRRGKEGRYNSNQQKIFYTPLGDRRSKRVFDKRS
jgi:MFS family permease